MNHFCSYENITNIIKAKRTNSAEVPVDDHVRGKVKTPAAGRKERQTLVDISHVIL